MNPVSKSVAMSISIQPNPKGPFLFLVEKEPGNERDFQYSLIMEI